MAIAERKQREKEARREAILDAAQSLIAEHGYQAMKMGDVAVAAELSKGTLYLYFQNKDDLCAAVATRAVDSFIPALRDRMATTRSGLEAVRSLLTAYCDFSMAHPHIFRFAIAWTNANALMEEATEAFEVYRERVATILQVAARAIQRGQRDGSIRADIDPIEYGFYLWTSLFGVMLVLVNRDSVAQRLPAG